VSITGTGLRADGSFDLVHNGRVSYTFRSPRASERGADVPRDAWLACLAVVTVYADAISVGPSNSACDEPLVKLRCDGKALWSRALAAGAAPDFLGDLYLYWMDDGLMWRLRVDGTYHDVYDKDCR
jgi:hypothetical protein